MKINLEARTELVEECQTASIEIVTDPNDKEKKMAVQVPCRKIGNDGYCTVYYWPYDKWRSGCPMSDRMEEETVKQKLNPLKASKRAQQSKG